MPIELEQHRFQIEDTEVERFSFEIIEHLMRDEAYTLFNVEEKVLENFNHAHFQIVYIYSAPLLNDAHLELLFEKLDIMKHELRRSFLAFRPKILVIATNCDLDLEAIEPPKGVQFVQVKNPEDLRHHALFQQVFPTLVERPFKGSLPLITLNINRLNLQYVKDMQAVFSKHSFIVTFMTIALLLGMFLIRQFNPGVYQEIEPLLVLNANRFSPHTLITNSLLPISVLSIIFDIFFLIQFGLLIERMYGSLRYSLILLLSILLSNTMLFAFRSTPIISLGFTPVIYGLFGSFAYAFLVFRRLLVHAFRRLLTFLILMLFVLLIFFESAYFMAIFGALVGGLISSFVVGIPYARNSTFKIRFSSCLLLIALIVIGLFIGFKV